MNISLGQIGQTVYDITGRLDYETDIQLNQELERQAFQRTVEDVRLRCGNLNGFFTTLFDGMSPTARWEVVIRDARILFRGEVDNESITFDVGKEWVEFDVFSVTKVFWDAAKTIRITKAVSEFGVDVSLGTTIELFITVEQLIKREITLDKFGGIIAGYSISALYAQRHIRFWAYTSDRAIGNNGRYRDLDPRTTIDELLKAMSIYYNAEFFIDPATQFLVMQKRGSVLNDVKTNLNDVIEDDEKIDIQLFDEQKIDYLGLSLKLGTPGQTQLRDGGYTVLAAGEKGLGAGRYMWLSTFFYRSGDLIVESPAGLQSSPLELKMGGSAAVPVTYQALLKMPLGPTNVTGRKLYRTRNSGAGKFYHVLTIENNTDEIRTDTVPDTSLGKPLSSLSLSGNTWIRYDEESGTWVEKIVEDPAGLNRPNGKVFEVTPKLRFVSKPYGPTASEIDMIGWATWRGEITTFVRTVAPHNVTENDRVKLSFTECAPNVDGEHKVVGTVTSTDLFIDGSVPTSPGRGGVMQTIQDLDQQESLDVAEENILDLFAFFGGETNIDVFRTQWQDMFYTKRRAILTAKGIDYRLGDSVELNRSFNGLKFGNGVIKKAGNNLSSERTALEIISI